MLLPFNQIINNAINFSATWADATKENAEAKPFWHEFFQIFGLSRKKIGYFERAVETYNCKKGYIDFFWPGVLLIEHKSKGKNLDKAFKQAIDYLPGLTDDELPRYIITSDFENFRIYDLQKSDSVYQFKLNELHKNIHAFSFITNYRDISPEKDEEITVQAGKLIGKLHKNLFLNNYNEKDLSILIIRLLFCLFADHTEIWLKNTFRNYVLTQTKEDGTDLGIHLNMIFEILDTPENLRQKTISPLLATFSYINGGLFRAKITTPLFTKDSRELLINCCNFTWDKISPTIIGSIFQSVLSNKEKKDNGVSYTAEKNILKVIKPLFLDYLSGEFEKNKLNLKNLIKLSKDISKIKIFDPACGSGNFLITSYKELRLLQLDVFKQIRLLQASLHHELHYQETYSIPLETIDVDSMYGFDIDDFATEIAKVALWLEDHKLNIKYSYILGCKSDRIPLKSSPRIFNVNALTIDWNDYIKKDSSTYIVGNPPFVASSKRKHEQCVEMDLIFKGHSIKKYKKLDYVSCWYIKALEFMKDTQIQSAFVSTNSIVQGEQVPILWDKLLKVGAKINFAHQSFKWNNDLSNAEKVYVVIIGFSFINKKPKLLYSYDNDTPILNKCTNINPYLIPDDNFILKPLTKHICSHMPVATKGCEPLNKHLVVEDSVFREHFSELKDLRFIRPFITAKEFLNNTPRWCIWLKDVPPNKFQNIKFIDDRITLVKNNLSKSSSNLVPYLFKTTHQPQCNYIAIPRHNITSRLYIPMAICDKDYIVGDSCIAIHTDDKYILGILMSKLHNEWVIKFSGKLKNDYRYSTTMSYNTFPFPEVTEKQQEKIRILVSNILSIRDSYKDCTLASLYQGNYMPKDLLTAHIKLDKEVEKLYGIKYTSSTDEKIRLLIKLYKTFTQSS